MKKLVFLFAVLLAGFGAYAQPNTVPAVSVNYIVTKPFYGSVLGTTADTATNAITKNYVLRVTGDNALDFSVHTRIDHVSGTVTAGKTVVAGSFDGVRYIPTDSITASSVTADLDDKNVIKISGFMYPYMKVSYVQTGTAVSVPKIFLYAKKN